MEQEVEAMSGSRGGQGEDQLDLGEFPAAIQDLVRDYDLLSRTVVQGRPAEEVLASLESRKGKPSGEH